MRKTVFWLVAIGLVSGCSEPAPPRPQAQTQAPAPPRPSPSFACAKATRPDEVAICGDGALARLDRRMSAMYRDMAACSMMGFRGDLQDDQQRWIRTRQACGADTACLMKLYQARIAQWSVDDARARAANLADACPVL